MFWLGGMDALNISKFSKNLYPYMTIRNRGIFINELFFSAGSKFFSHHSNQAFSYQYKIYSGDRLLTDDIKKSFPRPIHQENLIVFLGDHIGDSSLENIMDNFGVFNKVNQDKVSFFEALCIQFQEIVTNAKNEVDDVVATEYSRILESKNAPSILDDDNYSISGYSEIEKMGISYFDIARELIQIDIDTIEGLVPNAHGSIEAFAKIHRSSFDTWELLFHGKKIAGYYSFYSIDDLYVSKLKKGILLDDQFSDVVQPMIHEGEYTCLFVGLAILNEPKYRKHAGVLLNAFIEKVKALARKKIFIRDWYVYAYSMDGIRYCEKHFGMELVTKRPELGCIYCSKTTDLLKNQKLPILKRHSDLKKLYDEYEFITAI